MQARRHAEADRLAAAVAEAAEEERLRQEAERRGKSPWPSFGELMDLGVLGRMLFRSDAQRRMELQAKKEARETRAKQDDTQPDSIDRR